MTEIDWTDAGRHAGEELAEAGGSAANVDIDTIGFEAGRAWLDGVLDALHQRGVDAKSIAATPGLLDSFQRTAEWKDHNTYRGILLMEVDETSPHASIVIAA
jgi:hypothetical protein